MNPKILPVGCKSPEKESSSSPALSFTNL